MSSAAPSVQTYSNSEAIGSRADEIDEFDETGAKENTGTGPRVHRATPGSTGTPFLAPRTDPLHLPSLPPGRGDLHILHPIRSTPGATISVLTFVSATLCMRAAGYTWPGRWTMEEHNMFLEGLKLHGKGWKQIAQMIRTRTVVQIRTHAQKYFQKLAKAQQNGNLTGEVTMDTRGGACPLSQQLRRLLP